METFKVKYYAGTYSGVLDINASSAEDAICKARHYVRSRMTLSMYADGYKIIDSYDTDEEDSE